MPLMKPPLDEEEVRAEAETDAKIAERARKAMERKTAREARKA